MAVGGAGGPGGGGNSGRGGPGGPGGPGGATGGRGGTNGAAGSGNNNGGKSKGDATSKGPDDGSRGVGQSTSTAETGKADSAATEATATDTTAQDDKSTVSDDAATTDDKTEQAAQDFAEGLLGAMMDESAPEAAVDEAREVANEIAQETVEEAKGPVTAGDLAEGATAFDRAAGMLSAALEDSSRFGLGTKAVEMAVDTTGALTGGVQAGQDMANQESLTDVALGTFGTAADMVDVSANINDLVGNKGRIAGALAKGARVMGPIGGMVEGGLQAAYAETPADVLSGGLKAAAGGVLLGGAATGPGAVATTVAAGGLYGTSLALDYTPLGGMFNSAYSNFTTPAQPAYRDESGGGGGGGGGGGW